MTRWSRAGVAFECADLLLREVLASDDPRRRPAASHFVLRRHSCRRSGRGARSTRAKSMVETGCADDVGRAEGQRDAALSLTVS
jgi:hypothetical protein